MAFVSTKQAIDVLVASSKSQRSNNLALKSGLNICYLGHINTYVGWVIKYQLAFFRNLIDKFELFETTWHYSPANLSAFYTALMLCF